MEQLQQMLDNAMKSCSSAVVQGLNNTSPQETMFPKPCPILPLISSSHTKGRTLFTKEQLAVMEAIFASNIHYPDIELRRRIAEELDLHETRITTWFKNRRARTRLSERQMLKTPTSVRKDMTPIKIEPDDDENQPQAVFVFSFDPNNVFSPAEP